MAPKIATARITFSASKIDFADDTLADEIARTFSDTADEFMAILERGNELPSVSPSGARRGPRARIAPGAS